MIRSQLNILFFFFNDTATTEIYTLSLHDALPISRPRMRTSSPPGTTSSVSSGPTCSRSEEHTSELQSRPHLVCRLLLEKKKKKTKITSPKIKLLLLSLHIEVSPREPANMQ